EGVETVHGLAAAGAAEAGAEQLIAGVEGQRRARRQLDHRAGVAGLGGGGDRLALAVDEAALPGHRGWIDGLVEVKRNGGGGRQRLEIEAPDPFDLEGDADELEAEVAGAGGEIAAELDAVAGGGGEAALGNEDQRLAIDEAGGGGDRRLDGGGGLVEGDAEALGTDDRAIEVNADRLGGQVGAPLRRGGEHLDR